MVSCVVIDDDQDIVNVLCEIFEIIKVDVLGIGNNGKDAVELYEKHSPDIVFTDLQMPEYDGLYAVENIKDKNADARIIVVTGDLIANHSVILDSLNVPIINKPFDIHVVKQSITDIMLAETTVPTTFEIQYKFKGDDNYYSCTVTYDHYRNLKSLSIVDICEITNNKQKNIDVNYNDMQKALDLAYKNDTSHIRNLSEIVR